MPRAAKAKSAKAKASAPWTMSADAVAERHGLDPDAGLTAAQVTAARAVHGYNELDKEEGKPLWKLVLEQFDDALVKILLLAAVVSFALAFTEERAPGQDVSIVDFVEPGVILLILVLNAIVGVWQESNAESALEALKEMQSETARCLRDGEWIGDLPARELVPGDLVEIRTGDPRESRPGRSIVIPDHPSRIMARDVDLDRVRRSYLRHAAESLPAGAELTDADRTFLIEETRASANMVEEAFDAARRTAG